MPETGTQEERDHLTAQILLRASRTLLGLTDPDRELVLTQRRDGVKGRRVLRFAQHYRGLPVWPADVLVELDSDGDADLLTGGLIHIPADLPTTPVVDAVRAATLARAAVKADARPGIPPPLLIVYAPRDRVPRLAWKVGVRVSPVEQWLVIVDALQEVILARDSQVRHENAIGSGADLQGITRTLNLWQEGLYYFTDTSKAMFDPLSDPPSSATTRGGLIVLDAQGQGPNGSFFPSLISSPNPSVFHPEAVSAAYGLSQTYDYFLARHGRNAVDGAGGTMTAVVRVGQNFNGAFWSGQTAYFGTVLPFAGALDIVAHEFTHGIVEATANLIYKGEAGALHEAFADIFGEMVEAYAKGAAPDWKKGGTPLTVTLQDYINPGAVNCRPGVPCPARYSEYDQDPSDNGGIHRNSNIIVHAFYLLADGMAGAIGRQDAEQIFYCTLTTKLVSQSQFVDARLGAVTCAEQLFGIGSPHAQRTSEAFDAVEIFEGPATPPPQGFPAINAQDAALFLREPFAPLLGRREPPSAGFAGDPPNGVVLEPQDPGQVNLFSVHSLAISRNGRLLAFVNGLDLYQHSQDPAQPPPGADQNGTALLPVTRDQTTNYIYAGVSPDGNRLAYVPNSQRSSIVVRDLVAATSATYSVASPSVEGASAAVIQEARTLEFTADGKELIFDGFTIVTGENGVQQQAFWALYSLTLDHPPDPSGTNLPVSLRVLVPPVPGRDHEFPVLSQTSDQFVTFESYDVAAGQSSLLVLNRFTGQLSAVGTTSGQGALRARPHYTGDDSAIVYTSAGDNACKVIPLAGDRMTAAGPPDFWLLNAYHCLIYRRGAFVGPMQFPLTLARAGTGSGLVTSVPSGIICGTHCAQQFARDTRVTLIAKADAGSAFVRWDGDLDCADGIVDMAAARNCTAVFGLGAAGPGMAPVSVAKSGLGDLRIISLPAGIDCGAACTANFPVGVPVQLSVLRPPDPGGTFVLPVFTGWSGDPDCADGVVTPTGPALNCTATFDFSPPGLATATLQVTIQGSGTVTSFPPGIRCSSVPGEGPGSCLGTFAAQTTVILRATAPAGGDFTQWSSNGNVCEPTELGTCKIQAVSNVQGGGSVSAQFSPSQSGQHLPGDDSTHPIAVSQEPYTDKRSVLDYPQQGRSAFVSCTPNGFFIESDRTIWYEFSPKRGGKLIASTKGSNFDTAVTIYNVGTDGITSPAVCNDNETQPDGQVVQTSRAETTVYAGFTYLIRVERRQMFETGSSLVFSLRLLPGTINTPIIISHAPFTDSRSLNDYGARESTSLFLPVESCHPPVGFLSHEIYYQFTAQVGGTAILSTEGSQFDTVLFVVEIRPNSLNVEIGCSDDIRSSPPLDTTSRVVVHVKKDMTYIIRVRDYNPQISGQDPPLRDRVGAMTLRLQYFPDPPEGYPLTVNVIGNGSGSVTVTGPGVPPNTQVGPGGTFSTVLPAATQVSLLANQVAGSSLVGWNGGGCGVDLSCQVTMDQPQTVAATFVHNPMPQTYTLTVSVTGSGQGSVTDNNAFLCSSQCVKLESPGNIVTLRALPNDFNSFAGWSGCDAVEEVTCRVNMTGNLTVQATFRQQPTYTLVTIAPGAGGRVESTPPGLLCTSGTCGANLPTGSGAFLVGTATDATGMVELIGCDNGRAVGGGTSMPCLVANPNAKHSVVATFSAPSLRVEITKAITGDVTSDPPGISCGFGCTGSFPAGTVLRFTPENAVFQNQGITCESPVNGGLCTLHLRLVGFGAPQFGTGGGAFDEIPAFVSMVAHELEVRQKGTGSGRLTSTPQGVDCRTPICTQTFNDGTNLVLTATPDAGSVLAGWEGCESQVLEGTSCVMVMNQPWAVSAIFNSGLQTLNANRSGGGAGTITSIPAGLNACSQPSCATNFASGANVRLKALAAPGSTFIQWDGCDAVVDGDCLVTMSAPRTVTPKFRALPVKKPRPNRTLPSP